MEFLGKSIESKFFQEDFIVYSPSLRLAKIRFTILIPW